MAKKDISLFIGDKEILGVKDNIVKFKDGTSETFTETQLQYIITKEPKDDTELYELEILNIVKDLLDTIEKHDLKKGMVDVVLQRLIGSYNDAFHFAIGKAFGTYKEGRHPSHYAEDIRISDIKRLKDL